MRPYSERTACECELLSTHHFTIRHLYFGFQRTTRTDALCESERTSFVCSRYGIKFRFGYDHMKYELFCVRRRGNQNKHIRTDDILIEQQHQTTREKLLATKINIKWYDAGYPVVPFVLCGPPFKALCDFRYIICLLPLPHPILFFPHSLAFSAFFSPFCLFRWWYAPAIPKFHKPNYHSFHIAILSLCVQCVYVYLSTQLIKNK